MSVLTGTIAGASDWDGDLVRRRSYTMAGGARVGGAGAVVKFTFAATGGGASVGGDGSSLLSFKYIAVGGARSGGDGSPVGVTFAPLGGGVEAGGDGSGPLKFKYVIGPGFAVGGDGWTFTRAKFVDPSGGVAAGGSGSGLLSMSYVVGGGPAVGGAGSPRTITIPSLGGGAGVGGDAAAVGYTFDSDRTDGGPAVGGDAAAVSFSRIFAGGDGGALVGGDGAAFTRSTLASMSGGAGVGGDSFTTTRTKNITMSGGAGVGGHGAAPFTFTEKGQTFSVGSSGHRGATTRRAILNAILQQLIAQDVFESTTVWIGVDPMDMPEAPPSDQFAILFWGGGGFDEGSVSGGGVSGGWRSDSVEVRLFSRLATDQVRRFNNWTINETLGAFPKAGTVESMLHLWDLYDASRTLLLVEPMREISFGSPSNARLKAPSGWGQLSIVFEVKWTPLLTGATCV